MGYEWDLFVSYVRRDPIGPWVHDYLLPQLQRWLGAVLKETPRVFVDVRMENGVHWPSTLSDALLRSKHMLAIWAPPYFGSPWCMSEWRTMKAREDRLGLGRQGVPGLTHAIRFIDGDTFPDYARAIQTDDYSDYNTFTAGRGTERTKAYRNFERRVRDLSEKLALQIANSPPWDPEWPVMSSPDPDFDTSLTFDHVALKKKPS
jgi:hypothetical protein